MHPQAALWIADIVTSHGLTGAPSVLDLGGRDVNGTIHNLFHAKPRTLDILPSEGVDIVADAATWEPDALYDVVLCTEVFEHTPDWPQIIDTARFALRPMGTLIATCARDARPPHSAIDGGGLREGEYYANLSADVLAFTMSKYDWQGLAIVEADGAFGGDDLYCWAVK